jgi:hypothetical protein
VAKNEAVELEVLPDLPEVSDALVVLEVDGQEFHFPRDQDDWPTGAIVAAGRVRDGRATYDEVVECLLGDEQWSQLKLLPWRSFKEFLKLFSEAMDEMNK